jgi:hypothetical protein
MPMAVRRGARVMMPSQAMQHAARVGTYLGKTGLAQQPRHVEAGSSTHQAQLVLKQACIDGTREFRAAPLEPIRLHLTDLKEN